jgi:hypothetical protein
MIWGGTLSKPPALVNPKAPRREVTRFRTGAGRRPLGFLRERVRGWRGGESDVRVSRIGFGAGVSPGDCWTIPGN